MPQDTEQTTRRKFSPRSESQVPIARTPEDEAEIQRQNAPPLGPPMPATPQQQAADNQQALAQGAVQAPAQQAPGQMGGVTSPGQHMPDTTDAQIMQGLQNIWQTQGQISKGAGYQNPGAMLGDQMTPNPAGATPMQARGYNNPGAALPETQGITGRQIGQTLGSQMLKQGSVEEQAKLFQDFMRKTMPQRSVQYGPSSDPSDLVTGGMRAMPESDAALFDRGMKAFQGLDTAAGAGEKLALDKFLGVGKLGNETTLATNDTSRVGNEATRALSDALRAAQEPQRTAFMGGDLETRIRQQLETERMGAFSRSTPKSETDFRKAGALAGLPQDQINKVAGSIRDAQGGPNVEPPPFNTQIRNGLVVGPSKPLGVPRQSSTSPEATPGNRPTTSQASKEQATKVVEDANKWEKILGSGPLAKAEAAGSVPAAVTALQDSLGESKFSELLQSGHIEDYLRQKYGGENFNQFRNPGLMRLLGRGVSNIFSPKSPEQALMERIRAQQGLGVPTVHKGLRRMFGLPAEPPAGPGE